MHGNFLIFFYITKSNSQKCVPNGCHEPALLFTEVASSGATLASTVVSGDADALVSRILTYPDLSLLADTIGNDGSEGGGSGGAAGEGITMYAVAPTPPASATPAAPATALMTPQVWSLT